jgi:DNA-directed RNA polymerase specialized sigma24 family protein
MEHSNPETYSGCFPPTLWTQILEPIQRGDDAAAQKALVEFCQRYRQAVYEFIRRRGCGHEDAEDLTQSFFQSRVLLNWDEHKGFLHTAERREGKRFRSFLCYVVCRFLQEKYRETRTAKRGGGAVHLPLEEMDWSELAAEGESYKRFGREFDRVFAWEIIHKATQRSPHSQQMQAHLRRDISQAQAALELGMTENAFKQAYSRFRDRFKEDIYEEVAKVAGPDPGDVQAEIKYLISLFQESA